jgi:hypothetical protein
MCTTRFNIKMFCFMLTEGTYVFYIVLRKKQLRLCTTLPDSFLKPRCFVFTARYELHLYVNFSIIFVIKVLAMGTGL